MYNQPCCKLKAPSREQNRFRAIFNLPPRLYNYTSDVSRSRDVYNRFKEARWDSNNNNSITIIRDERAI